MASLGAITFEEPVHTLLSARPLVPIRVAIYLRTKSPLSSLSSDQIANQTCTVLKVASERSKLLSIQKWPRLTALALDLFHEDYNLREAHHVVNLPVLLVDYGRPGVHVKVASSQFRQFVNDYVARQFNLNGWEVAPPFFRDQTGVVPPTYANPRDTSLL
ncbi:hypothetical protein GE09DRAFT_516302 [Coniochaeta sp. 2T2.1]|nr:hypothetical protein GE09DRAFT_516302 [Coniochaeta sp. 2T2.1]